VANRVQMRMISGTTAFVETDEPFVIIGENLAVTDGGKVRRAGSNDVVVGRASQTFEAWPEGAVAILEERDASD
jgi:hypothetical protein